jgi:nitroreductase/Pyruvate/2-oxoacid:ferredoxin oxidoreductase delta subunit
MNWVSIEKEKCTSCGICAMRCPLSFVYEDDGIVARASEETCSLCGHCVALCPADAIVHHKMDMANFVDVGKGTNFETDEFIRFIRERRSHRYFQDRPIPKENLQKLVDVCRYAPSGGNLQDVEVIVVQNPEKRQKLSDLTVDLFIDMGAYAEKALEQQASGGNGDEMIEEGQMQTLAYYKGRLSRARDAGFDAIFYKAPVVFIFHALKNTRTPKDDCVIAATTMSLTARTMGLESTFIGLFEIASRMSQSISEELRLPPDHEVFSVLIMGFPGVKYYKTVDRKPINARWE